eukprot:CAMPEP_0202694182 /NCGR_PEP_ID=MMETSP1385-20130828/8103_1 /ASSEMBLY_ACC=CAM_ASM_000861 /TAXON_ID=933848 /ORGANISM="Elphidium margaritaceum" /LENGTH=434 /DNA_ID=CAMNT_0049349981 /DNA_START=70 /DNA_END=1374 /DNA_ORIENTATION=+
MKSNGHAPNGNNPNPKSIATDPQVSAPTTTTKEENKIIKEMSTLLDKLEHSNCLVDVREGLQTFLIYVSNIIKHPLEAKYRKIRVGNANYQVRLGHIKYGESLLTCIGYRVHEDFLILPSALFTTSNDLHIIKQVRNLIVIRLEKVTATFREVPRQHELATHKWSCCLHAVEAHTIGRRPTMEDDHIMLDTFCDKPYLGFFGLFDGHGGRATVDFLTCSFYLNLKHYLALNRNLSMSKALDDVYQITDKQIHRQQIYQSGATAATLLIDRKNKRFYVANAGDTRVVLCRKGKAIRLTKDHKADDAEEAAMIRKRGGTIGRMKRVNGLLAVTRAFGDHLLKPPITVKPTMVEMDLHDGDDHFVILACDGVWDVLSDEEVAHYVHTQILKKSNQQSFKQITKQHLQKCLHQICLDIIKNALDRRSQDNISCMIVVL